MKSQNKQTKNRRPLKRSTQDCIPVKMVFRNGLFLEDDNIWSRVYSFTDIAFTIKPVEEQKNIMEKFGMFLNSLPTDSYLKVCAYTHKVDMENLLKDLYAAPSDTFTEERYAYNDLLRSVMCQNELRTEKYIVLCTKADTQKEAELNLRGADIALKTLMTDIGTQCKMLTTEERLELLQQIYNRSEKNMAFIHEGLDTRLPWMELAKRGLNFKDVIAPQYLSFTGVDFEINDYVGQSLYMRDLPNKLSTVFYKELSALPFEGLVTYFLYPKNPAEVAEILRKADVGIRTELDDSEGGDHKTRNMASEIEAWTIDIQERDQKMFDFDLCVVHFADTKDKLKDDSLKIRTIAEKQLCSVVPSIAKQERYFNTALPLGCVGVSKSRYITTEALGLFEFFDEVNTAQKGGQYYGTNAVSGNVIVINKKLGQNYNSMILGSSGSGKSVSAKLEITGAILNSNDRIFIIDPEGEYVPIVNRFGGAVVKILPMSKFSQAEHTFYLNACDLNTDTSADRETDPTAMKIDFLCGLIETMLGGREMLTAAQTSILQKCITQMYESYIRHLIELNASDIKCTIDRQSCPTLGTLSDLLLNSGDIDGQRIATRIQPYVNGIYSTFAHTTNIDIDNRIVCFDLHGCSDTMLNVALKVCLNDVWNRTLDNKRKGLMTRVYFDEAQMFLQNPTSANYFDKFWRRFRKWGGMPTAITQKVSDLLSSPVATTLLSETVTTLILSQKETEQGLLQEALGLHPSELKYIKNAPKGSGLILTNGSVIPISNTLPTDNPLYELFTTKVGEGEF